MTDQAPEQLTKNEENTELIEEQKRFLKKIISFLLIFWKSHTFLKMDSDEKSTASFNIYSLDTGILFILVFANCQSLHIESSFLVLSC